MNTRIEYDSIGSMAVPKNAYYGIQSLRANKNFNITGKKINSYLIISLAEVKKAAAITNNEAGLLDGKKANAIIIACDEIIKGKFHDQFIVDGVIANRAIEILGAEKGDYSLVHPNDDVNMAQSTNDVFPTAGKLTILKLLPFAIKELERLYNSLMLKSVEFDGVIKMGRTQLQDAVPMRLGQSFHAFASVIGRDIDRLDKSKSEISSLNIGGTAIGTSINASSSYLTNIIKNLRKVTGEDVYSATDLIDATQNLDGLVSVSGTIKTCAINLSKIANDLRLLSSGPKTGLCEINLPAKQNGSSIMPGKINPVIPEVVSQVSFNIIGNDFTINMAAEAGQLELNAFEPVLFYNIFESIETLSHAVSTFVDNCIVGITANADHCMELLESSVGIATALCPYIGYKKSAEIAKKSLSTGISIRNLVLNEGLVSKDKIDTILNPLSMTTANAATV